MKLKHKYIVRMQSVVPEIKDGWRYTKITPIRTRTVSTLDRAIELAISGSVDNNASHHYAVISESPGKFKHVIRFGSALDGLDQRKTGKYIG